jgi:hypothetical protein
MDGSKFELDFQVTMAQFAEFQDEYSVSDAGGYMAKDEGFDSLSSVQWPKLKEFHFSIQLFISSIRPLFLVCWLQDSSAG